MRLNTLLASTLSVAGAGACLISIDADASCGAAFCSVNTDWTSETAITEPGSMLDLRYEYIKQDQPRRGTDRIAVGAIPRHHDEVSTTNRNVLLSYAYTFDSNWGVSVVVPFVSRDHYHVHNHRGEKLDERWNFDELADVRVSGRYQWPGGDPLNPTTTGISFGVKLPTGRTSIANGDGAVAERTLQPGTGTTDALLGAYFHQRLPKSDLSWFAQAQYQHAFNSHENFKPGEKLSLDLGVRKAITDLLGALLQLNVQWKGRDSGSEAEPEDTGGKFVALSPGLGYSISQSLQLYAFVQLPIHQDVNGVQLTARRAFVAGISGRF